MPEREFTTEDMAMVAYLRCNDYHPERLERNGDGCCWIFRTDHQFFRAAGAYEDGTALVEPRKFALKLGAVRSDMYKFLKVKRHPIRGNDARS